MLAILLLAAAPLVPAVLPGTYRCRTGAGAEEALVLRADYSYRWRDDYGVGTWRLDRREGVFLIATGPLALRDPRDGRYARGRIDLTFADGERLACRIGTEGEAGPAVHRPATFSRGAHFIAQQEQPIAR